MLYPKIMNFKAFCFIQLLFIFSALAEGNPTENCKSIPRDQLASPNIDLKDPIITGTSLKPKILLEGKIEGVCIKEAVIFQNGEKYLTLRSILSPEFKRFNFRTTVDANKNNEIRVYTIHGDRIVSKLTRKANTAVIERNLDLNYSGNVDVVIVPPIVTIPTTSLPLNNSQIPQNTTTQPPLWPKKERATSTNNTKSSSKPLGK